MSGVRRKLAVVRDIGSGRRLQRRYRLYPAAVIDSAWLTSARRSITFMFNPMPPPTPATADHEADPYLEFIVSLSSAVTVNRSCLRRSKLLPSGSPKVSTAPVGKLHAQNIQQIDLKRIRSQMHRR